MREQLGETGNQRLPLHLWGHDWHLSCPPELASLYVLNINILSWAPGPCSQLRFGHINNPQLQLSFQACVSETELRVKQRGLPHKDLLKGKEKTTLPSVTPSQVSLLNSWYARGQNKEKGKTALISIDVFYSFFVSVMFTFEHPNFETVVPMRRVHSNSRRVLLSLKKALMMSMIY